MVVLCDLFSITSGIKWLKSTLVDSSVCYNKLHQEKNYMKDHFVLHVIFMVSFEPARLAIDTGFQPYLSSYMFNLAGTDQYSHPFVS